MKLKMLLLEIMVEMIFTHQIIPSLTLSMELQQPEFLVHTHVKHVFQWGQPMRGLT